MKIDSASLALRDLASDEQGHGGFGVQHGSVGGAAAAPRKLDIGWSDSGSRATSLSRSGDGPTRGRLMGDGQPRNR